MTIRKFPWGAATFFVVLLCAIPVGYKMLSSYKTKNYQVEYASETDKKFYQKMVEMKKNSTLIFNGFPTCLTSILSYKTKPGDAILYTETDTLYLVCRDLNRADINRYPCYVIKDNHNQIWSLFRHNDKFHLNREDETKHKDWLEVKTD
jgi:hypothetical protein